MDIIDAINVFTSMREVEFLFLAYNISRCYSQGQIIRDLVDTNLQAIASFNGHKKEFHSFRDIIDWHNFVYSPLQKLVRSGGFIVTDADTPFPYSAEEFLQLLNKTSFFTGMVALNYPKEDSLRLPEIKYRILKSEAGFEFVAPPTKPDTRDPYKFFDQNVDLRPSVCSNNLSEFIVQLPPDFKKQTFGGTSGVCGLRFCSTFGEAIDQLLSENLGVHILPHIYKEGIPYASIWCSGSYRADSDYEVSYALEASYKADRMKLKYQSVMVMETCDPQRKDMEGPQCFDTTPYVILRDPQPYFELPLCFRYAAYFLLVVKWEVNSSRYGDRNELLEKNGSVIELNGNTISFHKGDERACLASYYLLSAEEITQIKLKYNYTITYLRQHAEMYFYEALRPE